MKIIEQKLDDITDESLLRLIDELAATTKAPKHGGWMMWTFLTQCLYPWGSGTRYKLEKNDLNLAGLLVQKISRFQGDPIYQLCEEISAKRAQSAELYLNTALYVFLNKMMPDFEKKPKKYKFHPRDVGRILGD